MSDQLKQDKKNEPSILAYLKWQLRILKSIGFIPFYQQHTPYQIAGPSRRSLFLYKSIICIKTILCSSHIYILYSPTILHLLFLKSKTDGISDLLDSSLCISSNIIISWMCIWNAKKSIKILNCFLKVDRLLAQYPESPAQRLGKINHFNIYICVISGYIVFLMLLHCQRFFHSFSIHIFFYATFYQLQNAASCAFVVFVSSLMHLLRERFEFVNQMLAQYNRRMLKEEGEFGNTISKSFATRKTLTHSIANLRLFAENSKFFYALHNDLLDTFKLINNYAGFGLLAFLLYICYALLSCTYISSVIDWQSSNLYDFSWILSWIPLYLGVLILLAHNCEMTTKEANKSSRIISRIYGESREYQDIIDKFLLKCVKQELQFTAYGFFPIDSTTLFKIFSVASNYLVILIQFKGLEISKIKK